MELILKLCSPKSTAFFLARSLSCFVCTAGLYIVINVMLPEIVKIVMQHGWSLSQRCVFHKTWQRYPRGLSVPLHGPWARTDWSSIFALPLTSSVFSVLPSGKWAGNNHGIYQVHPSQGSHRTHIRCVGLCQDIVVFRGRTSTDWKSPDGSLRA